MNDDEALVAKQKAMSEMVRKSVSMTPIGELLAKRLDRPPIKPLKFIPVKSGYPIWPGTVQRRFMIVKGTGKNHPVNVIWVDDDDACTKDFGPDFVKCHVLDDEGFLERKDWHSYVMISEFKKENVFAIRCPASLTFEQRQALEVDDPPGHYEARLRSVRQQASSPNDAESVREEDME